jgi:hypothetical protein
MEFYLLFSIEVIIEDKLDIKAGALDRLSDKTWTTSPVLLPLESGSSNTNEELSGFRKACNNQNYN